METISSSIVKHIHQQINKVLLPAISDKYSITLEELIDFCENLNSASSETSETSIKAKPIKKVPLPAAGQGKELSALLKKVEECRQQNKFLNVSKWKTLS